MPNSHQRNELNLEGDIRGLQTSSRNWFEFLNHGILVGVHSGVRKIRFKFNWEYMKVVLHHKVAIEVALVNSSWVKLTPGNCVIISEQVSEDFMMGIMVSEDHRYNFVVEVNLELGISLQGLVHCVVVSKVDVNFGFNFHDTVENSIECTTWELMGFFLHLSQSFSLLELIFLATSE